MDSARIWETLKHQHDWDDLLIASDALTECGEELEASCLKWSAKYHKFPADHTWCVYGSGAKDRENLPPGLFQHLQDYNVPYLPYDVSRVRNYPNLQAAFRALANVLKHFDFFTSSPCYVCQGRGCNWTPSMFTRSNWIDCEYCHSLGYVNVRTS